MVINCTIGIARRNGGGATFVKDTLDPEVIQPSSILSHLINLSLSQYHVPDQWKTSIIFPIAKIPNPQSPSDFRPIPITPVLSRLLERIIVSTYSYPSLNQPPISSLISDQFAFRPTGSTTAAIISINHHTSSLLTTNPYVSLFSLDFTKAFDSVRHDTLSQKLASLNILDEIYNWLVTFVNGRSHVTRYAGRTSSIAYINASVVQGSVIGPSSYDILASDLHPLSPQNIILKYADDTYLLVPSSNRHTVTSELNHISAWAINKNLKLNVNKSRELIIHGRARFVPPPPIPGVSRVEVLPVLGFVLSGDLSVGHHLTETLGSCSRSLYAVRILKAHGLPTSSLNEVTRATVIARLLYTAPAWRGFATDKDCSRIDRFINRTVNL